MLCNYHLLDLSLYLNLIEEIWKIRTELYDENRLPSEVMDMKDRLIALKETTTKWLGFDEQQVIH